MSFKADDELRIRLLYNPISRVIIFEVFQPMGSRYLNVTDGQNVSAVQGHPRSIIDFGTNRTRRRLPISPS